MADEPEAVDPDVQGKKEQIFVVERTLQYYGTEDVQPVYAEVAAVRHTEHIFQLMFFQVVLPITEDPKETAKLESIPARCLARIVIPPELMADLHKAMSINMEKREKLLEFKRRGGTEIQLDLPHVEDAGPKKEEAQ